MTASQDKAVALSDKDLAKRLRRYIDYAGVLKHEKGREMLDSIIAALEAREAQEQGAMELSKKQRLAILGARSRIFLLYQDHLRRHFGPGDQRTIRDALNVIYKNANPTIKSGDGDSNFSTGEAEK